MIRRQPSIQIYLVLGERILTKKYTLNLVILGNLSLIKLCIYELRWMRPFVHPNSTSLLITPDIHMLSNGHTDVDIQNNTHLLYFAKIARAALGFRHVKFYEPFGVTNQGHAVRASPLQFVSPASRLLPTVAMQTCGGLVQRLARRWV